MIVAALTTLIGERRYDMIRVADITRYAGIGKSTFYDHFDSKDEVLLDAMQPILLALATAASGRAARGYVLGMVQHLWDRRAIGRPLMASSIAPRVQRDLAEAIRPHVERSGCPAGASIITATGIAAAQLAMLRSWLSGEAAATAGQMTDRLIDCSRLTSPGIVDRG